MAISPIADLSYRNYDGPLEPPMYRWWAIAKMTMSLSVKKKGFWVWAFLSAWWYLALIFFFFIADQFGSQIQNSGGGASSVQSSNALFNQVKWDDQFLHAFSYGQLLFFVLALMIAVGSIANDNRANALLVYLSKPCTKVDYLIGKWLGVFVPITVVVGAPMFVFYLYCFMSYRQDGFLHDPWLIFKLLLIIPLPGIVHASLGLAVSSLFRQGRLAGAMYAGMYFITVFFTKAMQFLHAMGTHPGRSPVSPTVDLLSYASIDGLQIGLAKAILGTNGGFPVPFVPPNRGTQFIIDAPNGLLLAVVTFALCGLGMLIAWSRVKAVEVVG